MDRLDARTASFFAIGLLVMSFGCKSGAALHALGSGAVTAAKVATVVAVAAAEAGPARERGTVVEGAPRDRACQVVCPGDEGYVCATAVVTVDPRTNQDLIVYQCDGPLALR